LRIPSIVPIVTPEGEDRVRRLLVRQRHPVVRLSVSRIDSTEVGRFTRMLKWTACMYWTIDLDRRREQVQSYPFCLKRCQASRAWCVPKRSSLCLFTWGEGTNEVSWLMSLARRMHRKRASSRCLSPP